MSLLNQLKPTFMRAAEASAGLFGHSFNFRQIWKKAILLISLVSLGPLIFITALDYNVTQKAIESENLLRTLRVGSNARRAVSYFFSERIAALSFVVRNNSLEELQHPDTLQTVLNNLQESFGGFVDLGVIDQDGRQVSYVGPYSLEGKDYSSQDWFRNLGSKSFAVSEVFLGFRNVPHFVIHTRLAQPDGSFVILRSALDTGRLHELLSTLELSGRGDAFLINRQGIIQTPTLYHGKVFDSLSYSVPKLSEHTEVREEIDGAGRDIVFCSAYIPESPFILAIIKDKKKLMEPWRDTRLKLISFLVVSVSVNLIVIFGFVTNMVNNMFLLDQRRLSTLHKVEYSNKLASIGRLAAGVAHEINNPLAIINEKAGLINDLFLYNPAANHEAVAKFKERVLKMVDSMQQSVERCGRITKRLLNFARHMDSNVETIHLGEIIKEVLEFLGKEAEYRSIEIHLDIADDIPRFQSDRGKLQQIFLNIINNAFAAMSTQGRLEVSVKRNGVDEVLATITDNGCGISEADLGKIFEPFFSTKTQQGGTGLGLSITYGLLLELGGMINVTSKIGEGTSFAITLPLTPPARERGKASEGQASQ